MEEKTHKLKLVTISLATSILTVAFILLLEAQRTGTIDLL